MKKNNEILKVINLCINQPKRILWKDLSFSLNKGEFLGIARPSGTGKTTLGKVLAQWQKPSSGTILFKDKKVSCLNYCPIQLVPQHPEKCFNPRRKIIKSIHDVWSPPANYIEQLSISSELLKRLPGDLSGGELARLALLRALDRRTKILIADEITSQLDATTQKNVWKFLLTLSNQQGLSMIIFSHNKTLLRKVCNNVLEFE